MKTTIYIEGGGDSKALKTRCREGFSKLFESAGFSGRMPRLIACGGRDSAFDDFQTAHRLADNNREFVAMLVDSEDPVDDFEKPWQHLQVRDNWDRPQDAEDIQVLLMVTCMETWIIADRPTLESHFGQHFQSTALPALQNLEDRPRQSVQQKLEHASRNCTNSYAKGKRSFEILGKLDPDELKKYLPSFAHYIRNLENKL